MQDRLPLGKEFERVFPNHRITSLGACLLLLTLSLSEHGNCETVAISEGPQLFLDDYLVAFEKNLERRIQQPEKHPANPLVVQDFPWEERLIEIYGTSLHEPDLGKFRMWYLAGANPDASPEYYMCYAESPNGIEWMKPLIGTANMPGFPKHNVVVPGGHGMCVLKNLEENDPQRRYRGLGGRMIAFSPDGTEWTMEAFKSAGKNDTSSSVVWWKGEYLAYVRNQANDPKWPGVMRAVALSSSTDFLDWTPKETIFLTDEEDGYPWTQVYGMAVTPYADVLVGIPWFLHLDKIEGNNSLGDMDVQLMVSRDGRSWERVADRETFLEPTPGTWDQGRVFPGTTLVMKDDLIHLYYTGIGTRHGEQAGKPGIGLATLPADRFVSLRPKIQSEEAILETHPLEFAGNTLLLNAEIGGEDLSVEVLDSDGKVVPGYSRAESRLLAHDNLRYRATWDGGDGDSLLERLPAVRPLALRFVLRGGELFAFQIRQQTL
jgi:hypothetical protein